MDQIQSYRIFKRVVECISFSKAADQLHIPRSTVSTSISQLEAKLGLRLVNRTTRRLSITDTGLKIYAHCCEILHLVDALHANYSSGDGGKPQLYRINVPSRIGRQIIMPHLPKFLDQHPEISIDLGMSDEIVDLIESGADCVLRAGTLKDSRLIQKRLGEIDFVNVASPRYLARFGTPESIVDLSGHYIVAYSSPTTARTEPFEWQDGEVLRSLTIDSRLRVNSAEGLVSGALHGLGIVQIPRFDVLSDLKSGSLVEILPDFVAAPIPLSIVYAHKELITAQLRTIIDWLEKLTREHIILPAR